MLNSKTNKKIIRKLPSMLREKNIWLYLFSVCFINVVTAQIDKGNSFLEIKELGTVDFQYRGATWYADEDVLMIIGGVDSLGKLDLEKGVQPNWQSKIIAYPNPLINKFQRPKTFDLPFGNIGFGASANALDGIYCIGGMSPKGESKKVFKVKWNAELQNIEIDTLPSLPVALAYAGAVYFKEKLYVARGYLSGDEINKNLFVLDLNDLNSGWETIETRMEKAVAFPSLVVQSDGTDDCLYIVGGIGEYNGQLRRELFKFNLSTKEWADISEAWSDEPPYNGIYGQLAKTVGNSSILFFEQEDLVWSERSLGQSQISEISVFNAITNAYTKIEQQLPFAIYNLIGNEENALFALEKNGSDNYSIHEINIIEESTGFGFINTAVLVAYFVVMLLIGIYFSKKQKTADDYFKGGKKIPFWAAGLSLIGTGLSAISFMAVPAKAFATDWAYYMIRLSTILMPIIVGLIYIPVFRKLDITTAYEYLQNRFNLATRLIGSLSFIIFQLGRIGIVLFLPAVAINVVTGFDVVTCIVVVGLISLIYTVMGGIEAVIWTDVLQVFILYGGIILCVAFISFGLDGGVTDIISIGQENNKFNIFDFSFNLNEPNFWVVVFGSFFTNLTTYGTDQTMVQRYLTTKNAKEATKSVWTIVIIGFLLGWLFFFMGTALFAYYKNNPGEMLHTMASNDAIFPWYIISQLPTGISGLLIAGIFAAAMSSLSSSMNSAATAYTVDFHRLFKAEFNAVTVGRIVTVIIGVGGILFAILFATMNVKSIWDEFLKIIGLITGGLGGVFLLGLVTEKANGAGVLIGLLVSGIVQYFVGIYQPFNLLLFTASGFVTCFVFGYLFSLLLPMYGKPIEGLTVYSVWRKK